MLWAVADAFTLLAAATRAADGIAGPAGGFSKQSNARTPESLSEIIVSLPAETLVLSRGPELNSMATAGGADAEDDDEGGEAAGRRSGKSRGRGGREGGGGDPMVQCSLLSPASALVFVKEFLGWAASETSRSPAALVAEGWDGGIGVWLGLIHSVQTLARALRNARGEGVDRHREGTGGASSKGKVAADDDPPAEAIALAIFQLRTAVGTPSAALDVLDPSAAAAAAKAPVFHDERSTNVSSSSLADSGSAAGNDASGARADDRSDVRRASRRPQPGTMITGFLKRMSERWKAALPWGLPSAAPLRRASPRLGRRSGGRREGGGFGGGDAPGSLKAEAEDLFFALRGGLLRAERLVLSILLVGPTATLASRAWTMRAALASARRRLGEENAEVIELGEVRPTPFPAVETAAPRGCTNEEPPESGSGPARAARKDTGSKEGPVAGAVAVREDDEEGDWGGLGSLCRLAATEMREGLEDGLSVKLSQAYLDLIELLGSAALEHQHQARRTLATSSDGLAVLDVATLPRLCAEKESRRASAGACSTQNDGAIANGDRPEEDAGGTLLSIVTCHTVAQLKLFKRLISGAVRFDGVGVGYRLQASRTGAVILAGLQARDRKLSRTVVGYGSRKMANLVELCPGSTSTSTSTSDGSGTKASKSLRAMPPSPPPPLERSSRLVVHCVQWIRARHGSRRGRAAMRLFEEDGCESSEEMEVGASGNGSDNGAGSCTDGYGDRDRDTGLPERESDGLQSRYSFRPEEVKFASSRECFVAMRTALVECETALSSAGSTAASSGFDVCSGGGGGGRSSTDGDLADVLATVSFGLREFFSPAVVTAVPTTKRTAAKRNEKKAAPDSAPVDATVTGPPSASAPAEQRGEQKNGGCEGKGTFGGASPLAALDIFPDTVKLLLMRVLERLYLVGRGVTLTASSVLAKPSSTATATVGKAQAASSPPLPPPPPPLPSSKPSPPPSKRRRQQLATADAGKPGDQAGGAPAKAPAKRRETSTNKRSGGGGGSAAVPAITPVLGTASRSTRSKSASSFSARQCKGALQGGLDKKAKRFSEPSSSGPEIYYEPKTPESAVNPLLAPLLPAAALASGDGLHLMLAARIWAEALRSRTQRGGDDPCRKRVR